MSIILKIIVGIGKKSNILYIEVYFIATSDNKYHVYATNPL